MVISGNRKIPGAFQEGEILVFSENFRALAKSPFPFNSAEHVGQATWGCYFDIFAHKERCVKNSPTNTESYLLVLIAVRKCGLKKSTMGASNALLYICVYEKG